MEERVLFIFMLFGIKSIKWTEIIDTSNLNNFSLILQMLRIKIKFVRHQTPETNITIVTFLFPLNFYWTVCDKFSIYLKHIRACFNCNVRIDEFSFVFFFFHQTCIFSFRTTRVPNVIFILTRYSTKTGMPQLVLGAHIL